MATLEVVKHTRKIWSVLRLKDKKWYHKLVEILIEIGIIVFAITFSLYLERQREESVDHHLETDFLQGLKHDLEKDIVQVEEDRAGYAKMKNGFIYFIKNKNSITRDSLQRHYTALANIITYVPNMARYQAIKSTGKLYIVKDKALLDKIIYLYEYEIPSLLTTTALLNDFKQKQLIPYLDDNLLLNDKLSYQKTFSGLKMANYLDRYDLVDQVRSKYEIVYRKVKEIDKAIDLEEKAEH
jgi:hypothetical protein